GRARFDLREALERAEEDRLRRVFRAGGIAEQPDCRGKDHVLIPPHERLKDFGAGHARDVALRARTPQARKSFTGEGSRFEGSWFQVAFEGSWFRVGFESTRGWGAADPRTG